MLRPHPAPPAFGLVTALSRLFLSVPTIVVLGACGRADDDYIPLDAGRNWDYRLTIQVLGETERRRFRVRNLGTVEHEGRTVAIVDNAGNARGYYAETADGVVRIGTVRGLDGKLREDDPEHYILRDPIEPGTSWTLPSRLTLIESIYYEAGERIRDRRVPLMLTYTIESTQAEVSVPAGTYQDCVKVRGSGSGNTRVNQGQNFGHVDVRHVDWYCPGVGLVKSERKETSESPYLTPGSYSQELVSSR